MKKGSYLVNTARGAVVDWTTSLAALDSGQPRRRGARRASQGAAAKRIIRSCATRACSLTPHAAFYSVEGERELRRKAAQNLVDWATTGRPRYVVVEGRN